MDNETALLLVSILRRLSATDENVSSDVTELERQLTSALSIEAEKLSGDDDNASST